MADSGDRAVGGRTSGLIENGEEVTWRARHFGITHEHTSRITAFDRPRHFRDSMVRGRFRLFEHDHYFETSGSYTVMRDILEFQSPFGLLGSLVDRFVLSRYLAKLLAARNDAIRLEAESEPLQGVHAV